jgi:DNA-directed RNA polymerase specialized sigma24 family protein
MYDKNQRPLICKAYQDGLTLEDVAKKFSVSVGSVRHTLKLGGIEMRERSSRKINMIGEGV